MINYILGLLAIIIVAIAIGAATYLIMESVIPKDKNNKKNKDCKKTRWGCCDDNTTPKYDQMGTNCITKKINFS